MTKTVLNIYVSTFYLSEDKGKVFESVIYLYILSWNKWYTF